ncbi:MAG TPA: hypothetical protein VIK92_09350 [Thermaerobacter sp.]
MKRDRSGASGNAGMERGRHTGATGAAGATPHSDAMGTGLTPDEATFLQDLGIPEDRLDAFGEAFLELLARAAPPPSPEAVERVRRRVRAQLAPKHQGAGNDTGKARPAASGQPDRSGYRPGTGIGDRGGSRALAGKPWATGVQTAGASSSARGAGRRGARRPGARWVGVAAAVLLLAAGAMVWAHPAVVQAALDHIARWIPGAGFVRDQGHGTRVLAEPVTVTPPWGRVTVESVVAMPELTEVRVRVAAEPARLSEEWLASAWRLELPNGGTMPLRAASSGSPTDAVYLWFAALPPDTRQATLAVEAPPAAAGAGIGSKAPVTRIPLALVDLPAAGLAAAHPEAWSDARSGIQVGVPYVVATDDEIVISLAARPAAQREPGRAGDAGDAESRTARSTKGGATGSAAGSAAGDDAGQDAWRVTGAAGLRLSDPEGRLYPFREARLTHGWPEAPTFDLLARFSGPLARRVSSLRLTVAQVHVEEPGEARMRIPLDRLAPGAVLNLNQRVKVGRWPVVVRRVARPAWDHFTLDLDLGSGRGGVRLQSLSVNAHYAANGGEIDPDLHPQSVSFTLDPDTDQVFQIDLLYLAHLPQEGFLLIDFGSPGVVAEGPWTVEIPLH